MRVPEFLLFLSVILGLALWTVHEETEGVRLGYRMGALEAQRRTLRERRHVLRYRHASLAVPERLESLAQSFDLGLKAPGDLPAQARPQSPGTPSQPVHRGPSRRGAWTSRRLASTLAER